MKIVFARIAMAGLPFVASPASATYYFHYPAANAATVAGQGFFFEIFDNRN